MKMRVIDRNEQEDAELAFLADGANTLSAIVNVMPEPGANKPMALNKVSVTSSAETSKGGVRRVLVRVEMPYMALDPASVSGESTNLVYSPTRSGRKISFHAVLTLPREAVEDLRGQRVGTPGVTSAAGQISLLANILIGCLQTLGCQPADLSATTWINQRSVNGGIKYDAETNVLSPYVDTNNGVVGVAPSNVVAAQSLVVRALLGSTPLDPDTVLGEKPTRD